MNQFDGFFLVITSWASPIFPMTQHQYTNTNEPVLVTNLTQGHLGPGKIGNCVKMRTAVIFVNLSPISSLHQ